MRPRSVHLLLLAAIAGPPTLLGALAIVRGSSSHNELSGIGVALGLIAAGFGVAYTVVTSVAVWRVGTSPRRVAAAHGGVLGGLALLFALWFLRRFV